MFQEARQNQQLFHLAQSGTILSGCLGCVYCVAVVVQYISCSQSIILRIENEKVKKVEKVVYTNLEGKWSLTTPIIHTRSYYDFFWPKFWPTFYKQKDYPTIFFKY